MTQQVFIVGVASTAFRKWPERSFRDLAGEAVRGVLADAGLERAEGLEQAWVGNCAMGGWGQTNIRGQVMLDPLLREGLLPARLPVLNVEGGCATASLALQGAFKDVAAGADCSLALGVEKLVVEGDLARSFALFQGGIDRLHPEEWEAFYREAGERAGVTFAPHPQRLVFLDVHAMQARQHMRDYGTTPAQLAAIASKNHRQGSLNPKAQYRFETSPEEVLADRAVVEPFTRAMCAPLSDGAAAALLCSERALKDLPPRTRERAVRVRACALAGGAWRELAEESVTRHAARKAYAQSGLGPADVDIAEVHDSTAFCELLASEMLELCPRGEGGPYAASGATAQDGERPLNLSGGLISKGHPLGATGLGQIEELVTQLRGEAGARQAQRELRVGLQQNAGGQLGFDEALCAVTILERT